MKLPIFVGSAFVAQYPTGGGNFWFRQRAN